MRNLVLLALAVSLTNCVSRPIKVAAVAEDKISILSLNAENLFDLEDDPEKNDESFLPLSVKGSPAFANRCRTQNDSAYRAEECMRKDWSARILRRKLNRLTDLLEQMNGGLGPDIIVLQEVENINVLTQWRDQYLQHMGYQTISLLEGPDERGIDNAVMSRLPQVGEAKLHLMDYSTTPELASEPQRPTRGILETHLRLPTGEEIAVFAVHFPSQGAPTIHRKAALDTLMKVVKQVPAGMPVLVGGDFNITSIEDQKEKYYKKLVAPNMTVSHMVGCGDCPGTMYYWKDNTWSFFDVLLFSKDLDGGTSPWQLDRSSIQLIKSSKYQWNQYGSPAGFREGLGAWGVTDHLPMYAELKLVTPEKIGVAQ